ncbi:MAG: ferritin family protein [Zestosphaera sp.]
MTYELIRKAHETEESAVNSYMHALSVLRLHGMEMRDLEEVLKKVAIETLIHRELMNGMLRAYDEALKKDTEALRKLKEIEPSAEEKAIIIKLLKDHLLIESEMIDHYKELAQKVPHLVLRDLAEALARNEEEHHQLLSDLIKKYEK